VYPATDELSKSFLADYLAGFNLETGPSNPFRGMSREDEDQDLIAQGRIGSIPPTSVTSQYNFLGIGGPGVDKVPYAAQEYGLYGGDLRGYAPAGVTLYGGRRGRNPGPGIKNVMGPQGHGMGVDMEQEARAPLDRLQLQLRKMGIPGM